MTPRRANAVGLSVGKLAAISHFPALLLSIAKQKDGAIGPI